MNLIVTGSGGQLGTALKTVFKAESSFNTIFLLKKELDITDSEKTVIFFEKFKDKKTILINCAAYTDVEKAESEPEKAYLINFQGVENLAVASHNYGMKLIHISTDFVFSGLKEGSYNENDKPYPVSVYGKSKLEGEKAVLKFSKNNLIIRTSWLYSHTHETFLKKIINRAKASDQIKVVDNEAGSPTYAFDLAQALFEICGIIIKKDSFETGIYHFCNSGSVSRFEYAKKIIEFSGFKTEVLPIHSSVLNLKAKRPVNSAMDNSKIVSDFGLNIRKWEDALFDAVGKING
jgi:dTDP-4-dehydrorhamnose reductase